MKFEEYLATLERGLRQNPLVSQIDIPILLASDDYNGLIKCRVFFWVSSYLDIYETVSTELGYPVRIHYSYTYLRDDLRVFRYDNAPHHPEIATHPHHKHTGPKDSLAPADQPGLGQILAEIENLLKQRT